MNDVRPGLIIVSPPCRMYSAMQNLLKDYRAENPEAMKRYMANRKEAQVLLDFAAEACELAHKLNLSFVLEHPATASSWHTKVLKRLCRLDGVHRITMDQCRFNLRGEQGLHRKATGILTNNPHIAERLEVRCTRDHTHEPIEGGKRSVRSQVYTPELIDAILESYRRSVSATEVHPVSWSQVNYQNERFDMFFTEAAQDHPNMLECETQRDKTDDQDQHDTEETNKVDFGTYRPRRGGERGRRGRN